MKHDGSDEYGITIPAIVTIVCFSIDIPHVWHRIVANLEWIVIINLIKKL